METVKHASTAVTFAMGPDVTYTGTSAATYGVIPHSATNVVLYSQHSVEASGGSFPQPGHIIPLFVAQDVSAWRLELLVSRLYELLSKITEGGDYVGLPDSFIMPPAPAKATTLRVVRKEPAEFRFIED